MEPNLKNKALRVIRTIKMYLNITGVGKMDFSRCWQCEQQKSYSLTNLLEKVCVLIKKQMIAI